MKKALIIILAFGFIFTSGCANNTPNISEQDSNANSLKPSPQVELNTYKVESTDKNSNAIGTETIENSFFFKNGISQLNYKGKFVFNGNSPIEKDIKLHINEVASLKQGKLYELRLDSIQGITVERLNLGYFYVQKDKIYKMLATEDNLNKLKSSGEIPSDSLIVCQENDIKDTLGEDEKGWHHYVEVNGDKCDFHSYNNLVETGYYESFTWEKGRGLINYRSGYGAERDSIELQLN